MVMEAGGRLFCVLVCAALFAASCATPPAAAREPAPTSAPAEKPAPVPDAAPTPAPTPAPAREFVASEELYRVTFREVQDVIAAITRIIAAGDYDGWLSYLTVDYVTSRSSADFLADASNAAVLKKNGIVLKSLKDYFNNVVVRSHLQATLDDIQFLDETHVKALALVQGTPVVLYYLVHDQGRWKVGLKPGGES
jgi:hypothetical protein